MKTKWPVRKIACLLTGLALVMILSQTAALSLAYFTTYVTARGGHTIEYTAADTEIREEYDNFVKSISVENTGAVPCFVRVKVLAGSQFELNFTSDTSSWVQEDDGYWYYTDVVPVGGLTGVLNAAITLPAGQTDDFNVVVLQECTPVCYRADGTPYADWTKGEEAEQ